MGRKTVWWILPLLMVLQVCQPVNFKDDLIISLDTNIIKTFLSLRFYDATTGQLIGNNGVDGVEVHFSGRDAGAVVTQVGERVDQAVSLSGIISLGLDPYDPYRIEPGHPVLITMTVQASDYEKVTLDLVVSKTGVNTFLIPLWQHNLTDDQRQMVKIKTGNVQQGQLTSGFRVIMPDNSLELLFPDSMLLEGPGNTPADGALSVRAVHYDRLEDTGLADAGVMQFEDRGSIVSGIFDAVNIMDLDIESQTSGAITQIPGPPLTWRFPVGANYQPGDSIPVWYFESVATVWKPAGFARVFEEQGRCLAEVPLSHLSLYAAGTRTETVTVSGQLTFTFQKPFPESAFDGHLILSESGSEIVLQRFAVRLFSGLNLPLSVQIPVGVQAELRVVADHPDFQLASDPLFLTIFPFQESFHQDFVLRPLKCRFSGTIHTSIREEFNVFPLPAKLSVIDDYNGSVYRTLDLSITSMDYSTSISLMLPEERPLQMILKPVSLTKDFDVRPEVIRLNNSCILYGQWDFQLIPNIPCLGSGSIRINLDGSAPPDPVPVKISFLRARDQRLVFDTLLQVTGSGVNWTYQIPVPLSTPMVLRLNQGVSDKPFTVSPDMVNWDHPCTQSLDATFGVLPGYAQLQGTLVFTFDPELTHDQVPLYVDIYKKSTDEEIWSEQF
ncbi:MAG: hypothetical protein J7L89_00005, partial [Bacteroidales bacterium]|nr:hypothetical protein [Bacteroidales bacterium]